MSAMRRLRANAVKAGEALRARIMLRRCTEVGALTRLRGGVIVENFGTLVLGRRVKLNGRPVPIELVALQGARLSIGDGTSINRGVSICAQQSIQIGRECGIGNDCLIFDTDFHDLGHHGSGTADASPVVIGDRVWLAARSVVLKGVTIGEGAVVCAGSVVATNVAPYTMIGGVPARFIRKLTPAEGAPTMSVSSEPAVRTPNGGHEEARLLTSG